MPIPTIITIAIFFMVIIILLLVVRREAELTYLEYKSSNCAYVCLWCRVEQRGKLEELNILIFKIVPRYKCCFNCESKEVNKLVEKEES